MKVVLFCGGLGMRLRDYSDQIPKPLVPIGPRPIMWHLMRYYAHYGHKDFILCLGYRGNAIKDYFLKYDETVSNDFVLSEGGKKIEILRHDISDWRITFVETGLHSSVGMRLRAARPFLEGEEMFLANYSDGLSDLKLDKFVADFKARGKTASFLSVPAPHTFHIVRSDPDQHVTKLEAIGSSQLRVNGGFFALRQEIFSVLHENEELVEAPFGRLIAKRDLLGVPHDGFWRSMDTFKDRQNLEELWGQGKAPWKVWEP
jgi:glucose-1-phosphate cytidylyltransferase